MHHADWLPTLLEAAGAEYKPAPGFELHGASQWRMLTMGASSSRNETITNIDPMQPAVGGGGIPPGSGNAAIITDSGWKLLLGLVGPPDVWSPPNASKASVFGERPESLLGATAPALNCSSTFETGVCFPGGPAIPGAKNPTNAPTAGACCTQCASVVGCRAWTWRASEMSCWIKGNVTARSSSTDCVSNGLTPPAPLSVWPLKNMTAQLFNLNEDPWERQDVAAQNPEIVAKLTARLAQWGLTARDPYWRWDSKPNPSANPSNPGRNGSWFPWLP
jgi:hypothetical protein